MAPNQAKGEELILIVEDDQSLREGLAMNFELQGYRVATAAEGREGLRKAIEIRPDLIVLDVMLPGYSGLDILAELRRTGQTVPVLILSARSATEQKIEGLELGADDYLAKPFELPELFARVEAMLRRRRTERGQLARLRFGDLVVDLAERRVERDGAELPLSAKEFDLLAVLARTPGRPYTREAILDKVWGWDFDGTTRTVDNFILSLRRKIELDPTQPRHILTVRQVGYKFEP